MKTIGGKIRSDYGWEVTLFHKLRQVSDGITFFEGRINWDRFVADHSPRFQFHVIVFNHTIIELNIYSLHHKADVAAAPDETAVPDEVVPKDGVDL